jgi:hypothetical protein
VCSEDLPLNIYYHDVALNVLTSSQQPSWLPLPLLSWRLFPSLGALFLCRCPPPHPDM